MAQTITQLTIAWLIATIEAKRASLAGSLAQTPVADWGAAPVRDVRNHEQDLHTAAQVLGDILNVRGAFADSSVPAVPHLEQARPIWLGLDLSADGLAELKKSLTDWRRNGERMRIECLPAPARQPLTKQEIINRFDFLEGVVNEHYYFEIVKVAEGIQAAALAAAPQAPAAPVLQLPAARAGRIYVAGPMTGLPDHNFPAFNAAAAALRAKGWHVENPAEHGILEGAEWADYLHYDMGRLATCSAVHLLPGWSKSRGASLEVHVATTLGMPIFYADGAEHVEAAPAAPAVDAQGERDAAFEAVRQRLCKLPKYSFLLDYRGNIKRAEDSCGKWVEFSQVHALLDPVDVEGKA